MSDERPDFETYPKWLAETIGVKINDAVRNRYRAVVTQVRDDLVNSSTWDGLRQLLRTEDDAYYQRTQYRLFASATYRDPEVVVKSFRSALLKSFRLNILDNPRFPAPPGYAGW